MADENDLPAPDEVEPAPDPWAHDPLSRPAVPPHDARDPISQAHRRDALEEAKRIATSRGRRAMAASLVVPMTIVDAFPESWFLLDHPVVDVAIKLGWALCILLWWQWSQAAAHVNAWEGEVLFTSEPTGE